MFTVSFVPLKDPVARKKYQKRWFQRRRLELIQLLGGKCTECDETDPKNLEIHDVKRVNSRSRPLGAYFNPEGKELKCIDHHKHTESWRRKRKR